MATTISDFVLRVKVQGQQLVDKLKSSVSSTDAEFGKATKSAGKFSAGVKGLGTSIVGMAGGVATAATAIAALGLKIINTADNIQDMSDATGISAGRLLNFKQSLIEAGGSAEDMEKMTAKLSVTLGDAAQGNEKTRKTFKDLGIALGDANGKLRSTDELLPEILSALGKIEDPAVRAATAVDLLGKSASKIDFTKVSAGQDAIKDEQIKKLAEYKSAIDKLANSIETELITAFGRLAIAMAQGPLATADEFDIYLAKFQSFVLGMVGISKSANELLLEQKKRREALGIEGRTSGGQVPLSPGTVPSQAGAGRGFVNPKTIAQMMAAGGTGDLAITDAGKQQIANAQAQTKALMETNAEAAKYASLLNDTLGMQQHAGDIARANLNIDKERDTKLADINKQIETELNNKERDSRVTNALVSQLREQGMEVIRQADIMKVAKTDELTKLQQQKDLVSDIVLLNQVISQDSQLKQLSNEQALIGLIGDELVLKQGLLSLENERTNSVLQAENKLRALGKDATMADINRADQEIANAKRVADAKVEILKEGIKKEQDLRNNTTKGVESAMEQIARSMDPFNLAQQATLGLFSKIDNSITELVTTGRTSFGDLAKSFGQMIVEMMLKQQVAKAASAASGFLGSLFEGLFRAEGGPVAGGQPYIVGEKGPEMFVPKSSGTIIPNNQMGSGGNAPAGNTYITNNISAIDAKSVAQLFAENRRTLFGSVQLAQKELSYGR